MGFLQFLKPRERQADQSPEQRVEAILSELEALEAERAKLNEALAGHAKAREHMLLDDNVKDEDVVSHDLKADRSLVRLERLTALENELLDDLRRAQGAIAERELRDAFDSRHDAAKRFSEAMHAALKAREALIEAHGEYDVAARRAGIPAAHIHDGSPHVLHHETQANFARKLEQMRAHEDARRARLDSANG